MTWVIYGGASLVGMVILLWLVRTAPVGGQDDCGFYLGDERQNDPCQDDDG